MSKDNYSEFSDDHLLDLMAIGNQSAFSVIYKRHWTGLYNAAYKRLKDHNHCQDILQNVFTDLWIRRGRLEIKNLIAYLHGAVRLQVYKVVHKEQGQAAFFNSFDTLISSSHCDEMVLEKELKELVDAWKKALPGKRREIFKMRYEMGLSTNDIAAELNISQKTVQNQLNTASSDLIDKLARFSSIIIAFTFLS